MEGTIRVTASAASSITAKGVTLHVYVDAERAIFGNAALEQSKELRDLTERLKRLGLDEAQFSVQGVTVSGPSGMLKSSKATFQLHVTETKLERLPSVLGALSDTKNLEVRQLEWLWDEFEMSVPLAVEAMRKAKRKAEAMASAIGVHVVGMLSASDSWSLPINPMRFEPPSAQAMMRSAKASPPLEIGVEYRATQQLEVTVTADFAVRNA
jgi:uncharacterized protein YggE